MSNKQKDQYSRTRYNQRPFQSENKSEDLSECRIITKNLVYVIGLSSSIANREKLIKYEYFGQYGQIQKIVVNKNKAYNLNSPNGPSYSAYVTFSKPSEASIAILSLDETMIDGHCVRASFGTTKYCSFFLKGIECTNKECLFLHKLADETDIIKRGDLNNNKYIFSQQHAFAIKIADIYNPDIKRKLYSIKKCKTVFPAPYMIYRNEDVIQNDPMYFHGKIMNLNNEIRSNNNKNNDNKNEVISDSVNGNNNVVDISKDKITSSSTSSSSSKEDYSEINHLNKDCSRFDFIKESPNKDECEIEIPAQIQNIITKNMNLYSLTKYMEHNFSDKLLKENLYDDNSIPKEIKKEWISFSYNVNDLNEQITNKSKEKKNKSYKNDIDEFSYDIERINNFVINKCDYDNTIFSRKNLEKNPEIKDNK